MENFRFKVSLELHGALKGGNAGSWTRCEVSEKDDIKNEIGGKKKKKGQKELR